MQGYDLDDTLAATEYQNAGVRGLANVFASAKVIYTPSQPFIVITARTHATSQQKTATEKWLRDNMNNYKGIYYVSGSEADIVKAKARIIRNRNLDSFTDNNTGILKALQAELGTDFPLYRMYADGSRKRY